MKRQQKVYHLQMIWQMTIYKDLKKKKKKYRQQSCIWAIAVFLIPILWEWSDRRERKWGRSGLLRTLFLIIDADGIIPLLILCSTVDRHSNLIAGQQITHRNNLVSVSIWSVGLHFSALWLRIAPPGYLCQGGLKKKQQQMEWLVVVFKYGSPKKNKIESNESLVEPFFLIALIITVSYKREQSL